MSFKLKELLTLLNEEYKFDLQENWDNSGIQFGNLNDTISGILVVMDITNESILFAKEKNINCILSHHPLFFEKIKNITVDSPNYKKLKLLFDNNINVISVHTPLDLNFNGISKGLSNLCNIENESFFISIKDNYGYGIVGNVSSLKMTEFLNCLHKHFSKIIYYGDGNKIINKVAVLGGSGAFGIEEALLQGCDLYISSDFKYHDVQKAIENGLNLIDLGHYESEFVGLNNFKIYLEKYLIDHNLKILIYDNNIFKANIF